MWETKVQEFKANTDIHLEMQLDEFCKDGWEPVCQIEMRGDYWVTFYKFLFKRQKQ